MVKETITFPVYRKYEGNRSFFKITSENNFTEIQLMGSKLFMHKVTAKTLPDFQLIVDMINRHNNHWEVASETEYENALANYNQN